ncbi:MAG: cysteine hydrolase [Eggerthellaceae bacterium]|nr:cysteine hydrolase [Eggerthellaceae bacterium]
MKRLLIVVDYQNDFVDGALGFPGADLLDARIAGKIRAYHDQGDQVIFTMDTHLSNYLRTQEGRNLPVEHCIEGTHGWELFGATAAARLDRDLVFEKPTFGSAKLFNYLDKANHAASEVGRLPFSSIELVGLVSNICVVSNAMLAKAACPEVPVIVDATCTASADDRLNAEALDILESVQVQVVNRP